MGADYLLPKTLLFDGDVVPPDAKRIGNVFTRRIRRRFERGAAIGIGDRDLGAGNDCTCGIPYRPDDAPHIFLGPSQADQQE
jgi:hypothetical protein